MTAVRKARAIPLDTIAGLLCAAASAAFLWVSYLPHEESLSSSLDSMYWPRLVLWSLLACSLFMSAQSWWIGAHAAEVADGGRDPAAVGRFPIKAVLGCAAYFLLVGIVGFLISTMLFCAGLPPLLGYRDWRRLAVFSIGFTASVYVVVIVLMRIALPRGIGVFRDISVFFY
jgi:hypothetical protein